MENSRPEADRRQITLPGGSIELLDFSPRRGRPGQQHLPQIVLLHEGLGSVSSWRTIPDQLASATGRRVVAYSRLGYGRSSPAALPRTVGYMHEEADSILPALLAEVGIEAPVLVGHSDGASIALLFAGAGHRVTGVVALAPHVFVEAQTVEGALAARAAYESETGDFRRRLARHHGDVDATFYGWNDIWLDPAFRAWSITERLPAITAPILLVQARDDPYGSLEQLDRIEQAVSGPVRRVVLETGGHAPQQAHPGVIVKEVSDFVRRARP